MYARGILFGKMVLELGDTCIAKNEKHGLYCDLEFKTKVRYYYVYCYNNAEAGHLVKGFFSGTYNALAGRVRRNSSDVGEISGRWSHVMDFKTAKVSTLYCLNDL